MKFRALTKQDVEARVQSIHEKGLILLLYKDARCDMRILDETVGAGNWQRKHYECKGNLFCSVGIKIDNEWVWKDDCGSESNTEKEKGEASDSFKRACFNWGIGRELYTSPFIWISAVDDAGKPNYAVEKGKTKDRFVVTCIKVEDGVITGLNIENTHNRKNEKSWTTVFVHGNIFD